MTISKTLKQVKSAYNLHEKYRNPAAAAPTTGDADQFTEHLLTSFEESQRKSAYKDLTFRGTVLYSSVQTKEEFESMYDDSFTSWVYERSAGVQQSNDVKSVTQSYVYILELCSCLPQIKHADFLEKINNPSGGDVVDLAVPGTQGPGAPIGLVGNTIETRYAAAVLNNKDMLGGSSAGSAIMKDLQVVERYPKVYSVNQTKPSFKDIITVAFRHEGDFSYGTVLQI